MLTGSRKTIRVETMKVLIREATKEAREEDMEEDTVEKEDHLPILIVARQVTCRNYVPSHAHYVDIATMKTMSRRIS
jgi:hypothetical protein